ncbi:DUF6789 family protein [Candidatus Desulforudis audaxviator]|uniref:Uncharacterized protein n=1 Tax=Desulforudis audaxviator (strain MP104C) TaxID=477974 RepID=B1I617_DESAP|nr:DUF6789 family protein [Candidatus Desulforudis audaxviator]ACA60430.1 hypothetical protein Daud_1938 [Candidatus Desulforudis audaxviator MP104C]AZK60487.1 hypothetical protein Daudx_1956 [Candidatus Desulforudis audaxviator]
MRDSIVLGAVAGTIGLVVMLAINLILFITEIAGLSILHQAARGVLPPGSPLGTAPALGLGLLVTLLLAIILGVLAVYIVSATGRDYAWFKGLVYGAAIWVLVYGLLGPLFIPVQVLRPDLPTSVSVLLGHLAYGLVAFLVAAQYRTASRERV